MPDEPLPDLFDPVVIREKLRKKFDPDQIGKLPKPTKKDNPKGHCKECGGYHGLPAIHVDFVGHAAVTDRLNRYVPGWTFTIDERFEYAGSCWVRITMNVMGVTRSEYGDGSDPKQALSNAIRRGAMRYGVAIDLWSKEDLETSSLIDDALQGEIVGHEDSTSAGDGADGTLGKVSESPVPADVKGKSDAIHVHGPWAKWFVNAKGEQVPIDERFLRCTTCDYIELTRNVEDPVLV